MCTKVSSIINVINDKEAKPKHRAAQLPRMNLGRIT